jgi:hypothetical protein
METQSQALTTQSHESVFSLQMFDHAQRVAKMLSSSNLIPKEYQGNIQNTMIALEISSRNGASPLMVMQNLYIVHGKPGWSSQFIVASINSCGRFQPLRFEMAGEKGSPERGCTAWTVGKGVPIPVGVHTLKDAYEAKLPVIEGPEVTMSMAKAEGWIDKNGSKWKTMPEVMLRYRAAAFFGRLYAPEILMGMQTQEEIIDITPLNQPNRPAEIIETITVEQLNELLEAKLALLNKSEFDNAKRIIENQETDSYKKLFDFLTAKTDDENTNDQAQ